MTRDQSLVALAAVCVLALVVLGLAGAPGAFYAGPASIAGVALGRLSAAPPP